MINCLIVDDEPIARKGLLEHINQIDFLNAVGECKSPVEAGILLQQKKIDLLYLDIQMPKMTGIEFLKNTPHLPPVIFTTAYSEYAIEGYELDILDYLLKPISFSRFYKSAVKAKEYFGLKSSGQVIEKEDYFFIKCNQKIEKIIVNDIIYVEGMSNYIIIHTTQKKYIAYLTFKGIEEQLPARLFIRIHRSYLIAVSAIKSVNSEEVVLNNITLPISKNFRAGVMKLIEKKLFKR
ncbi:MAG: response regulator transcription factor [Sphingobacteriales bacterium]|nr:response regulator transcription factor [Sphingobacteriales bacterium]